MMRSCQLRRSVRNQKGMTLVEAVVTMAISSVLLGITVLGINRGFLDLSTTTQELLNDLRAARTQASLRGVHFRLVGGGTSYQVERLQDDDNNGTWDLDAAFEPEIVELAEGLSVASNCSFGIEFTSRGMVAPYPDGSPPQLVILTVHDSETGNDATISVWPSGQIERGVPGAGA